MKPGQFNNIGREGTRILKYLQVQHHRGSSEQLVKEFAAGRAWTDLKRIPKPVNDSFELCRKLGLIVGKGRGENRKFMITSEGVTALNSVDVSASTAVTAYCEPFNDLLRSEITTVAPQAVQVFFKTAEAALPKGVTFDESSKDAVARRLSDVFDGIWHDHPAMDDLRKLYETINAGRAGLRILGAFGWYAWADRPTPFANKYPELWKDLKRFGDLTVEVRGKSATITWGKGKGGIRIAAAKGSKFDSWVAAIPMLKGPKLKRVQMIVDDAPSLTTKSVRQFMLGQVDELRQSLKTEFQVNDGKVTDKAKQLAAAIAIVESRIKSGAYIDVAVLRDPWEMNYNQFATYMRSERSAPLSFRNPCTGKTDTAQPGSVPEYTSYVYMIVHAIGHVKPVPHSICDSDLSERIASILSPESRSKIPAKEIERVRTWLASGAETTAAASLPGHLHRVQEPIRSRRQT